MCYDIPMSESNLQYEKNYSLDILDRSRGDGKDILVYYFMAELAYLKVPEGMTVVMIYPYDWNDSMTPWPYVSSNPVKGKNELGTTGGGKAFAEGFIEKILTPVEAALPNRYAARFIGGYSLGGLMASYMGTVLNAFDGCLSCSGSFWYPGALDYFKAHPFLSRIRTVYYSLGTKEAMTLHPERCQVEDLTREILANTRLQGIEKTTLVMHEGGHFTQVASRIEAALQYLLL